MAIRQVVRSTTATTSVRTSSVVITTTDPTPLLLLLLLRIVARRFALWTDGAVGWMLMPLSLRIVVGRLLLKMHFENLC